MLRLYAARKAALRAELMQVTVASSAAFGDSISLQHWQDTFEKRNDGADAVGFGIHFEERLLEIGIEGKRTGEAIGKLPPCNLGLVRLGSGELHDLAVQTDGFFLLGGQRGIGFIFIYQIKNFGLKKGALLIKLEDLEALLAL